MNLDRPGAGRYAGYMVQIEEPNQTEGPTAAQRHPRILVYRNGTIQQDIPVDACSRLLHQPGTLVWVDVERPDPSTLARLQQEFSLHPLAIEDLAAPHQRPKVDDYEDQSLIVLFEAKLIEHGRLLIREVAVFTGSNYLITVRAGPVSEIDEVRERWLKNPRLIEPSPLGFLLYRIASALVESYFPILDVFDHHVERVEERIFQRIDRRTLRQILLLRRNIATFRRAVAPQRDVFIALSRRDDPRLDARTDAYFLDLVDFVLRQTDTVDSIRDRLGAVLDSYLTLQSNSLNQTMKRLTALTVILTLPMIVSSIYGMNFDFMPELHWKFGYPYALGVMAAAIGVAAWILHRNDWL
ncbi:MAG: magnesium/cobalt transporter CorA [Chloroflexi bacterium]|nr:magnesium/cobalt transporter CorA [Chloroflexota bacterium]